MTTLIPKFDLMNGGLTPAGAVNRPINQKLEETISVKDFGAIGDGTIDDSIAFQNAINYIGANNKTLYIPAGEYLVNTQIEIVNASNPINIFGQGKDTIIKTTATINGVIKISATDPNTDITRFFFGVNIQKLRFNGPARYSLPAAGTGLFINGCQGTILQNVFFYGWDNAARFYNSDLITIANSQFQANNTGITTFQGGFAVGGQANSFTVYGCWINNNTTWGIEYQGGLKPTIFGNNFSSNGTSINLGNTSLSGATVQCPTVHSNYFEGDNSNNIILGGSAGIVKGGLVTANNFLVKTGRTVINCANVDLNSGTAGPLVINNNSMFPEDGVGPIVEITQATTSAATRANYNNDAVVIKATATGKTPVATLTTFSPNKTNGDFISSFAINGLNSSDANINYSAQDVAIINGAAGSETAQWILYGYNSGTNAGRLSVNGLNVLPGADNTQNLGSASLRWATVFAVTPSINTSDEREKQDIKDLSEAERQVAIAIKGLIKSFKFKDAVALKGDKARIHVGVIAQQVAEAFKIVGLNPDDYALFCYDEWEDDVISGVKAGNRYGIRYDELLAFVISAL